MSFHKQIERQLAKDFSPNEATDLVDYQDVVFHGRRLQALALGQGIARTYRAVIGVFKWLAALRRVPSVAPLNDHMRQDIGLQPRGGGFGLLRN